MGNGDRVTGEGCKIKRIFFFLLITGEISGCLSVNGNHLIKRDDFDEARENSIAGRFS